MCIGVGWRSGTRLRRNVSQIIPNSNGQVGGPGPGPVVLSARCRACRGMKSIKAPVFEGRNRSPNPSFGSPPPPLARPSPFSSVCLLGKRASRTLSLFAWDGGDGDGGEGGHSVSIFNERGNRRSPPIPSPLFSVFLFFFFFSYSSYSPHRLFFLGLFISQKKGEFLIEG